MRTGAPIDATYRAQLNDLARSLDKLFNGDVRPKKVGFALLMFEFGEAGTVNYISNAHRADMLSAMKEFIARAEGRAVDDPGHA